MSLGQLLISLILISVTKIEKFVGKKKSEHVAEREWCYIWNIKLRD